MAPISVKNLTVKFDQTVILDHLSVDLQAGKIVGLIGPSGAGKSTFINALLGMQNGAAGTVKLLGQSIPNREILGKIGFMGQSDALFNELTGQQNLDFFGALQGLSKKERKERAAQAAQTVKLTADLKKPLNAYSGGMKRRLSLAIALQAETPLLVLDEPTVGIDPELRRDIWVELRKQAASNKTILITTHVMDEAEKCDKVLLLRRGHFVASGSPAAIKAQFAAATIEEAFIKAGHSEQAELLQNAASDMEAKK